MAELDRYPGPNAAVDLAVLTLDSGGLAVLIQNRTEKPRGKALPGRFLRKKETVSDGLRAALEKVGLDVGPIEAGLQQYAGFEAHSSNATRAHLIGVFDKPGRDPRSTWSMSLAHYLVLPPGQLKDAKGELVPVAGDGSVEPKLLFDHDVIIKKAAEDLRARYEVSPDPENLCAAGEITLPELQTIHQEVLGERVRTDTFRRRMEALLDELPDPTDPTGRRTMTRASGSKGGPPTRLWAKRTESGGAPEKSHRLLRLPRAVE